MSVSENTIKTIKQPYWADFKIRVSLYSKSEEDGQTTYTPVDPTNIQFRFTYTDNVGNQLVASFDGVQRVNNNIEDGSIFIIVPSNTFKCGILKVKRQFSYKDSDFNDGYWDFGLRSFLTNIEIVG